LKRPVGSFGALNAFSFHETKNCICGEGGALVLRDPRFIPRAEILRQKGTNREQYFRGEVDKYSWVDIGSSYVPSELQTAYLLAQLHHLRTILHRRRVLHQRYLKSLEPLQAAGKLRLPCIPANCESAYQLFYNLLENKKEAQRVMLGLQHQGILAPFHFFPLHLSAMGRSYGYQKGDFPVTENISDRLLRLPFYTSMTIREQFQVLQALKSLF
jgi:dTDP-4-amino-4,6-dideoxygalactose transaminase